ncbi:MAG: AMP-binding protein [Paraglaciecola sp.]|uniref:AMP-binding protein n=1 Tax=Paraglaciecola sp. TaxID=1920173 RepID=UPI003298FE74
MPNLLQQLTSLTHTGKIHSLSKTVALSELLFKAKQIRQQNPELKQQKVLIVDENIFDFISALVAFDGWCQSIYIASQNLTQPKVDNLIQWQQKPPQSAVSQLVIDDNEQIDTSWFLATSGTTGEPKWYAHSFAALASSVKQSRNLTKVNWALMYQPTRFAGLQVLLQSLLSGANLIDVHGKPALQQISLMQRHQVNAISATPSLWRQLSMTQQLDNLTLKYITLGGEIADQGILDHLSNLFPNAQIKHIYASTEAGVGFVVTDKKAGFPVAWLASSDNETPKLKVSSQQHLMIKPKHLIGDNLKSLTDPQGYVDTFDKVAVTDERVMFLGRASGVINVGGNNVYPEKIEQVLLQSAEVDQARVYGQASPLVGALVVAEVVLQPNSEPQLAKTRLLSNCKAQLARYERPSKIRIVASLKQDASGKLNRKNHD